MFDFLTSYNGLGIALDNECNVSDELVAELFDLETFIENLSNSLYNGAYIDDYKYTKKLISNAYRNNAVQMETFTFSNAAAPTEGELKAFTKKLRETFLNFKSPSSKYNAWAKVGGYGHAIVSWSKPEDVVVFISNKLAAELDVEVLASAFNMDKADLMGRVYYIDSFDIYDDEGTRQFDGSNIYALICDKRWFKIRTKDMFMDEFYNANNRSWQSYLNVIKSFNYSLFANALMIVGSIPSIATSSMVFNDGASTSVAVDAEKVLQITTTPFNSTDTITFSLGTGENTYATITKVDNRHVKVEGEVATTGLSDVPAYVTITATNGTASATIKVTVTASA